MFNRRRWSNELLDSLIDYQSREASRMDDSLECDADNDKKPVDVLNDSTDISSMLASLDIKNNKKDSPNLQNMSQEHSACTSSTSDGSNRLENNKSPDDLINFSSIQDSNNFKDNLDSLNKVQDIMNTSMIQSKDISKEHSNQTPAQFDHLFNLNERLVECTTLSSDTETIKLSSSDASIQSIRKSSKEASQSDNLLNLNERIAENVTLSSDSGTIKLSSCNSSLQNVAKSKLNENQLNEGLTEVCNEDNMTGRYFSSPFEFPQNNEEMLSMMEEPDVLDALIALEEVLSPFEENSEKKSQEPPHIFDRLSQKFKETPTRFTEKLVSIIEQSVISESPSKINPENNPDISLDRMTGEFRKLCKFIEDESMPDWAPSLINATTLNKTETPEFEKKEENGTVGTPKNMIRHIQVTPAKTFTPKAFKCFVTPKNKIGNLTPINRFTPSADKSFEYWEAVCNMMSENQDSAKKKVGKTITIPEASKLSMDEMLTICNRQMASLDESTSDIRNSEPCKKNDCELKLKVLQVPRSKSVAKIDSTTKQTMKSEWTQKDKDVKVKDKLDSDNDLDRLKECKNLISNEKDVSDIEPESPKKESNSYNSTYDESEDSYQLSTRNRRSNVHKKKIDVNEHNDFEDSYHLLTKNQRSSVHQKNKQLQEYKFVKSQNSKLDKDEAFEDDFELLPFSPPPQIFREKLSTENLYDNDDQDSSLLVELAKRRQRCLETAKLMLEIDREDPTSGDEDKTCLETLYKLGIQDKTFADVEKDKKFIDTLSQCFEYKNYIQDKSTSIVNMLQKYQSPEILKKKATSVIKSSTIPSKPTVFNSNKNQKISATSKSHLLNPNSAIKRLQSETTTPAKKPLLRVPSASEKKTSLGLQEKMTPRVIKKLPFTSNLRQVKSTSKLSKKPSLSEQSSMKSTPRVVTKTVTKVIPGVEKINSKSHIQPRKVTQKLTAYGNVDKTSVLSQKSTQCKKLTPKVNSKSLLKQRTPSSDIKPLLQNVRLSPVEVSLSPEYTLTSASDVSCVLREKNENRTPESQLQVKRLFVTPGKSANITVGRKKPPTYFKDEAVKNIAPQKDYNNIESPLGLYIKGTDAQFVQNAQTRTNDRLLTPISNEGPGKSPKLKFNLASKENTSPAIRGAENIVLPTVRYQSAKKVCLTNDESPYASLNSLTPNSRTKKLLEPVENTVVIRHEGRVIDYSPKSKFFEPDMSIRAQHVAEKASTIRRKCM